jgi:hypothetical protein
MNEPNMPIIFLRVGWMSRYRGFAANDTITGGGAFVRVYGYSHEIFNFKNEAGRVYGYVQARGAASYGPLHGDINLQRLGGTAGDESINGVLVVWVAGSKRGRIFIVGWYKNATVYRRWQPPPPGSHRRYNGEDFGFYVTAASEDATLLAEDARIVAVPRGKGGMGHNVWYADALNDHGKFKAKVFDYVGTKRLPPTTSTARPEIPRQPDPFIRQQVERAAVAATEKYYASLGYEVRSVEADNVGWDLTASLPSRGLELKLEVKGLSGSQLAVDITPNEYAKMKAEHISYRLCVVTEAITAPALSIFGYSNESKRWEDQESGRPLNIDEIVAARCTT